MTCRSFADLPILCSDLDNTLVDHSEAPEFTELRRLQRLLGNSSIFLVYNSGRSAHDIVSDLIHGNAKLRMPDLFIGKVGTEICSAPSLQPDTEWQNHLDSFGWNKERILGLLVDKFPTMERQRDDQDAPHWLGFTIQDAATAVAVRNALKKEGFGEDRVHVIHSHGKLLDIVPAGAGKGNALKFVLEREANRHGFACSTLAQRTLCCGDSGNDCLMMALDDVHGCVVGNADSDLLSWLEMQTASTKQRIIHYRGERGPRAVASALIRLGFIEDYKEHMRAKI